MSGYVSWNFNPATGDYVMDATGSPVNNNSLLSAAYIRICVPRTKWMYAPDARYGSDFYLFNQKHLSNDPNTIETVSQRALQPLIDDGRASAVTVETVAASRSISQDVIQITDVQGVPQNIPLSEIGF